MQPPRERQTPAAGHGGGSQQDRRGGSIKTEPTATDLQPAATHDPARCAPCSALDIYEPNARLRRELRAWAKGYRRICDLPEAVAS